MRPLDDQTAARLEPFAALLRRALLKQPTQTTPIILYCWPSMSTGAATLRMQWIALAAVLANVPDVALPNAMESRHLGHVSATNWKPFGGSVGVGAREESD